MLTLLIVWLTSLYQGILQLHRDIDAQWVAYLCNYLSFKWYQWTSTQEGDDSDGKPIRNQSEALFIYGVNSDEKTFLEVKYRRRPIPAGDPLASPGKDQVEVQLKLKDVQGNVYSVEIESSVVEFSSTKYRAPGFEFEPLDGRFIARLKYSGSMKRNSEKKRIHVELHCLCVTFSEVFDSKCSFDAKLMAKELIGQSGKMKIEEILEKSSEELCKIKGTLKVSGEKEEKVLQFSASIGRRLAPKMTAIKKRVVKMLGFDKNGLAFQMGLVKYGPIAYRYGFLAASPGDPFAVMERISLVPECIERLPTLTPKIDSYEFTGKFTGESSERKFFITRYQDEVKTVTVDGVDGLCFVVEERFEE